MIVRMMATLGSAAVFLGACQVQKTVVVEQASAGSVAAAAAPAFTRVLPPLPHPRAPSPCDAPAGTGPFEHTTKPISAKVIPTPPRALAEHVRGCAGVRFRISRTGTARDIEVVADYPLGYGFGDAGRKAIESMVWPPRDDLAWHYVVFNVNPPSTR